MDTLRKVQVLLDSGQPEKALERINSLGSLPDTRLKNARGVCWLRMGALDDALRVFRELVLASGGILLRSDVPVYYKTNFAMTLLLRGNVSGCASILNGLQNQDHPTVERLRRAFDEWQRELTFLQRLGWKLGNDPAHPVRFEFPPGDLS